MLSFEKAIFRPFSSQLICCATWLDIMCARSLLTEAFTLSPLMIFRDFTCKGKQRKKILCVAIRDLFSHFKKKFIRILEYFEI